MFRLIFLIIALTVAFPVFAGEIDDLKKEIEQRAKEIEELKKQEEEYKGEIGYAHKAADSLKEVIIDFNEQIKRFENEIDIKEHEISALSLEIKRTELEMLAKEEGIKRTREYIAAILREIYENGDERVSELIFKYDDFSEFFNQVESRELLQESLAARIDDIKDLKEKLEIEKEELSNYLVTLEAIKRGLDNKSSILELQRIKKNDLLKDTRNEEWRYRDLLNITKERQGAIQREIFDLEDKLRQAIDESSVPAPRPGVLSWPTEGLLTQGYGCTEFAKTSKFYPTCFHNGIDVAASYGTEVVSARIGKVIAVQNAPYAYGKWIAVEHDNGLITLYGHLSFQSARVGQGVARGEVIGYMGSTGFSTGSHLHFTVYAPNTFSTKPSTISGILPIGATINPFDYLP